MEDFYYHSTSDDNDSQHTADSYPRGKTLKKGSGGDVKLIGITGLKKVETTTKDDYMDCSSLEDLNETEMIVSRPVIKPRKITMSKEPVVSKYKVCLYLLFFRNLTKDFINYNSWSLLILNGQSLI